MSAAPAVELRQIIVEYGTGSKAVRAIDDVSLAVPAATSLAIIGRSGSGKSSLVSVMGLMRSPAAGLVMIDGERIRHARQRNALRSNGVAMVFQSFHLEPHLTVRENAMLHWYLVGGGPERAARSWAGEVLDLVGLRPLAERRASDISGGERQRVAIARALFSRPRLLIADEPTGNLDEDNASAVCSLLFDAPRTTGAAVVVVTHDPVVARGADARIVIARGRVQPGHAGEVLV